jgi:feruloyl esterase
LKVANSDLFPPETAVTSASVTEEVTEGDNAAPSHCDVIGTIHKDRQGFLAPSGFDQKYTINWRVRLPLPADWNGRSAMQGGGGTDGSVPGTLPRLRQGYATEIGRAHV